MIPFSFFFFLPTPLMFYVVSRRVLLLKGSDPFAHLCHLKAHLRMEVKRTNCAGRLNGLMCACVCVFHKARGCDCVCVCDNKFTVQGSISHTHGFGLQRKKKKG